MPKLPRNVRQPEAIRAFLKAGGIERGGKGGHRVVKMPNGHIVSLPTGVIKAGLLSWEVKQSGLTLDQFAELL